MGSTEKIGGLRELVPDGRVRAELEDMPRLSVAYFEACVLAPPGWDSRTCGYVLLSGEPYGQSAAGAREPGWPVVELRDSHHLALVTDPASVADALDRSAGRLRPRRWPPVKGGQP